MTHLPPPIDPETGRPEERDRPHADRSTVRRSSRQRAGNPQLELAAPIHPAFRPFAWQHGPRLYLLVYEGLGWVLAELEFLADACHYVEIRRTTYRWPREAVGVLLSRSLAVDERLSGQLAVDLTAWLAREQAPVSLWLPEIES